MSSLNAATIDFESDALAVACDGLAIYERSLPTDLAVWLNALPPRRLPHGRVLVSVSQSREAVLAIFRRRRVPSCSARDQLLDDIEKLTESFARYTALAEVDVRIEVVRTSACWRFHRDRVPLRLITTYRGTTTQWVAPQEANAALRDQSAFKGTIHSLPLYAVGLFQGDDEGAEKGIVHRSPPMSRYDPARLLLVLNPPSLSSPPLFGS